MHLRSLLTSFTLFPLLLRADDLQALSDEFTTNASRTQWMRLNDTEGWNANQLELWDINADYAPGHMTLAPYSSSWYGDMRGVLVYKEVTGDFIATMRMQVTRRGLNGALPNEQEFTPLTGSPTGRFSLAGIFVRNPRNISAGAPDPIPEGYPADPVPEAGEPGHYVTDWNINGDDYIFLSYGGAASETRWQYEVKNTINGNSRLYWNDHGVPPDPNDAQIITLQFIKIGQTVVTLRKHADGPWIVENRYTPPPGNHRQRLPDFQDTLQVGITTYTDWNTVDQYEGGGDFSSQFYHNYTVFDGPDTNPDLIAHVDYFRLQRPDSALTEQTLRDLPLTFMASPLGGTVAVELPATGAGAYLGDNANTPAPADDLDSDGDGTSNLIEILMGSNPAVADSTTPTPSISENQLNLTIPHNGALDDLTVTIEHSSDMSPDSWLPSATRTATGWATTSPYSISEDATQFQFSAPSSPLRQFYRVRVETE